MSFDLYIGVDPGLRGGFAVLEPSSSKLLAFDIPTFEKKNGRSEVDVTELAALVETYARRVRHVIVEDVGAMTYTNAQGEKRGQGAAHSFAFGKATGTVLGVLGAVFLPVIQVKPAVWKALLKLDSDKSKSRALAAKLFPANAKDFARKMDDGRAEAALLAYFGADRFK